MARHKDIDWNLPQKLETWDQLHAALLMDIRDELKELNALLHCPHFTRIPQELRAIRLNTTRRRKRKL